MDGFLLLLLTLLLLLLLLPSVSSARSRGGGGERGDAERSFYRWKQLELNEANSFKGGEEINELFTDDLRKHKFLKMLTGPLYFSAKCKKLLYRVYYSRDCTNSDYLRRCARLLSQLSKNKSCRMEPSWIRVHHKTKLHRTANKEPNRHKHIKYHHKSGWVVVPGRTAHREPL